MTRFLNFLALACNCSPAVTVISVSIVTGESLVFGLFEFAQKRGHLFVHLCDETRDAVLARNKKHQQLKPKYCFLKSETPV